MEKEALDLQKQQAQNPLETERTRNRKVYVPKVDIYETKDAMVLIADMPGVDEQSVDVTLEKNILTITGNVEAAVFEGKTLAYAEYDIGDYQRAFTISDEVDQDRIEAAVENGVLRVTLPKVEKAKIKKIAIKGEK
ncbi:MAG TPA: Hsp20/alpha crystallin family protein [Syntrophales bacterium]|jgi:HSP20 family molecular chaperone IbpA|nr:Hsp20/alpha crystallin family protein [Syntrophales bacterium]HON23608.1 Hsp20/alpha crystallin family protein [Syntrophales bacterium]HOU78333.1 Hsp20/alpha crystallin family protein [Syntrophales bacterium]HPC31539.1 Hsp20/alpha crystallin family protein [Syntrophales bacterium]HQG34756.1 Hsp20/alpha crystallin family protein [Syntrophales bacterium]